MSSLIRKLLYIGSRSETFTRICRKVVDYRRNENNCDFNTNGEADFVNKNSNELEIIFDVGANVGDWSNLISDILPACKIYSFEPSKKTFNTLQKNTAGKNIQAFNIGLGERKESKTFYNYGDDSTLNSSINRDMESFKKTEESVDFDTLDNFCKDHNIDQISFLKIDVEGGELSVLKGAREFISTGKIKYIQFEYGGTYIDANIRLKDVFLFFKDTPYEIYKIMQHGLKKIEKYDQDLENFQYSNYLAILNHARN